MKRETPGGPTKVILVTGVPGSGKSAFIARTFDPDTEVMRVRHPDDLDQGLHYPTRNARLVIEAHGLSEPVDLMQVLVEHRNAELYSLEHVVAVMDAARFFSVLHESKDIDDGRTEGEVLVNQIELANVVAMTNVERAADEVTIRDVVLALNPFTCLATDGLACAAKFAVHRCVRDTAWLAPPDSALLRSGRVDILPYRARRPFHPQRLAVVLARGWPGVLRTKGFVWIASRGEERGVYIQAGEVWRLDPAGPWWASIPQGEWPEDEEDLRDIRAAWDVRLGDRRQELLFIGIKLDRDAIGRDLDACLLDGRELAAGPSRWRAFLDPLPAWNDGAAGEHDLDVTPGMPVFRVVQ
jgi:G3E family GTPase